MNITLLSLAFVESNMFSRAWYLIIFIISSKIKHVDYIAMAAPLINKKTVLNLKTTNSFHVQVTFNRYYKLLPSSTSEVSYD